jgi:ABC-type phosphate/phosphonate transport system ATPase subunit
VGKVERSPKSIVTRAIAKVIVKNVKFFLADDPPPSRDLTTVAKTRGRSRIPA